VHRDGLHTVGQVALGGHGADRIAVGAGDDVVHAGAGDDEIDIGSGRDSVDGGAGFDVVSVEKARADFVIQVDENGLVVMDRDSGESDHLARVEFVTFEDGGIAAGLGDAAQASIARLYEAVLGRVADAGGLHGWLKSLTEEGKTLSEIASGFVDSAEFQALHSGLSNAAFVDLLYRQALDREADETGRENWIAALDAGMSRADVAVGFAASIEATNLYDYIAIIGLNADVG